MKAQSSGEAALHMFSEHLFMRTPLECFNIILKKSSKGKLPEKYKIPNFWLIAFHETHTRLTQLYNLFITDPTQIPQWFFNGITFLLLKSDETNNPK